MGLRSRLQTQTPAGGAIDLTALTIESTTTIISGAGYGSNQWYPYDDGKGIYHTRAQYDSHYDSLHTFATAYDYSSTMTTMYGIEILCFSLYPSIFLTPTLVISLYLFSISLTTQPKTEAAFFASVITGHNKCGMPSYVDSSSIFGSININLHFSGECLYKRDKIIVLIQTDFPDPVVPAISK